MNQSRQILIVEDEALIAADTKRVLENEGYRVIHTGRGEEAVSIIEMKDIDLVLMDIELGEDSIDGSRTAELILDNHLLPIVFYTHHTEKEIVDKVKNITCYGYVLKNAGEFVLLQSIKTAFELFETHKNVTETEKHSPHIFENTKADFISTDPDIEKMNLLLQNISYPMEICDSAGTARMANRAFFDLFGITKPEDFIGSYNVFEDSLTLDTVGMRGRIERVYRGENVFIPEIEIPFFQYAAAFGTEEKANRWFELSMVPAKDNAGSVKYVITIWIDITHRKNTEQALRESEERYRLMFEKSPDAIFMFRKNRLVFATPAFYNTLGYAPEEMRQVSQDRFLDLIHPEDRERIKSQYHDALKQKKTAEQYEYRFPKRNGEYIWVLHNAGRTYDAEGNPDIIVLNCKDITRIKQLEQSLNEKSEKLESALNDRELLLREMSHRIKNNLAMISGFISLKSEEIGDRASKEAFSDIQTRINSILNVYRALQKSESLRKINIKEYISNFLQDTLQVYSGRNIRVKHALIDVILPSETVINLGIIINELFTNAVKYAFPKDGGGTVRLVLEKPEADILSISVIDDGIGLPEGFSIDCGKGMGMSVVRTLADQMGGSLTVDSDTDGTVFTLRVPLPEDKTGAC